MDREPVSRLVSLLWLPLGLALVVGCSPDDDTDPHFDGPVAVTVLHPEQGGPYDEPVGFVSNSRSGRITALDLKHGRILSDRPTASFLRAPYVATGRDRILGDIAVRAPDAERVTLYVADLRFGLLVEAPYVVGVDEWPVIIEPSATEPVFVDVDGSGDSATVADLQLRRGYTTTEDWVFEFDGEAWTVTGSRSGRQGEQAPMGERWHTGWRELELEIQGSASAGDRIELSTDTGVVEHDLGGSVQAMALHPDQDLLALSTFDRETAEGRLVFFDPDAGEVVAELSLADGSQPYRMVWTPAGDRLFVADASLPVAWEITLDKADPGASALRELAMHAPLADLAYIDTSLGARLAVAPVGLNRVDLFDLDSESFVVVNPYSGDPWGLELGSPVTGLAASPFPVRLPETVEHGARVVEPTVAVSLFSGHMVQLEATTGCLAQDEDGPRSLEGDSNSFGFEDLGVASDSTIWMDEATERHVSVNDCAGVAPSEEWQVVFDEVDQSWWVEGGESGEQLERAFDDLRYVSDEGAISFTIMTGLAPATDGDRYYITIDDGVLRASGNLDRYGDDEHYFEMPGRPSAFWYDAGPTGGGWDELDRRAFVLWPITNSDYVGRVRLSSAEVEIIWN
jgi:hypothetical protein